MSQMVRKQVYIEPMQDTILKKRSHMLGITEAEVIRRAIDTQVVLMHSGVRNRETWERKRPLSLNGWPVVPFQEAVNSGGKAPMKKDSHAMADRILIDTNILLYAYDRAEPVKQPKALIALLRGASEFSPHRYRPNFL